MKLFEALKLAERIKSMLAPFCVQIEIAGSIRRAREHVNDIDFVVLPKPGSAAAELRQLLRKCTVSKDGPQCMIVRSKEGVQVDLWFAHDGAGDMFAPEPGNWGSLLLCRTGSREHNIKICERAQSMGLKWETSRGLVAVGHRGTEAQRENHSSSLSLGGSVANPSGRVIASLTEEEIFKALGMDFIPPALREVRSEIVKSQITDPTDWSTAFSTQEP